MRNAFADEVTKLAGADPRVVLFSGDIGNRLFDNFKAAHGRRFLNCGVAEANMIGMSAGAAMCGLKPVAYTITPFITTRVLEQIRVDVCYHRQPVVIVGVGAGLSYASLGATHQACEDIAFLRTLPHMRVVCPADAMEVRGALRAALASNDPTYIRLGKKKEPVIHKDVPAFVIGQALTVQDGRDVCLLSTGNILPTVLDAAQRMAAQGVSARVVSFHTVKPLDTAELERVFAAFPVVATIEEHGLIGGFGAAVAEWLSDRKPCRARLVRIGVQDEYVHEAGGQSHLRKHFGLTGESIAQRVTDAIAAVSA